MGRVADRLSDFSIITSDNPRSEDPRAIVDDALAGVDGGIDVELDRRTAIARAIELAGPGDVVLIAGKGHEAYQIVDAKRLPFSDLAEARLALSQKQGSEVI